MAAKRASDTGPSGAEKKPKKQKLSAVKGAKSVAEKAGGKKGKPHGRPSKPAIEPPTSQCAPICCLQRAHESLQRAHDDEHTESRRWAPDMFECSC